MAHTIAAGRETKFRKRQLRLRRIVVGRMRACALGGVRPEFEVFDVIADTSGVFAIDRACAADAQRFQLALGNPEIICRLRGVEVRTSLAGFRRAFAVVVVFIVHRKFMPEFVSDFAGRAIRSVSPRVPPHAVRQRRMLPRETRAGASVMAASVRRIPNYGQQVVIVLACGAAQIAVEFFRAEGRIGKAETHIILSRRFRAANPSGTDFDAAAEHAIVRLLVGFLVGVGDDGDVGAEGESLQMAFEGAVGLTGDLTDG